MGIALMITFPRLLVAIVIRTFKAMFGHVCAELAVEANDAWEQLAKAANEEVSAIEASILNGTLSAAAPPMAGAVAIFLVAAAGSMPAHPTLG